MLILGVLTKITKIDHTSRTSSPASKSAFSMAKCKGVEKVKLLRRSHSTPFPLDYVYNVKRVLLKMGL